jgi:hypothetical protein
VLSILVVSKQFLESRLHIPNDQFTKINIWWTYEGELYKTNLEVKSSFDIVTCKLASLQGPNNKL